jgi:hypothetical protein
VDASGVATAVPSVLLPQALNKTANTMAVIIKFEMFFM